MTTQTYSRPEFEGATLKLGKITIDLAQYATTGLRAVAIGPSGCGKTNLGLVIAEQLAAQGWICVIVDPEGELESLYGSAVRDPEHLADLLRTRERPLIVVSASDADEFAPYAAAIFESADRHRRSTFICVDEGQVFSKARGRKGEPGATTNLLREFAERGRKRALDFFITALRPTGSLDRAVFNSKNLTLIGCQEDPASWMSLSGHFLGTKIGYHDLRALSPGEFICLSRQGTDKVSVPLAQALAKRAPAARRVAHQLPGNFVQWSQAMNLITDERLAALSAEVREVLAAAAGLTAEQINTGNRALSEELELRA